MRRRMSALLCVLALLLSGLPGALAAEGTKQTLRCAVLYAGDGEGWKDAYSHLEQSLLLNMTVQAIHVSGSDPLEGYDVLYPDPSIMASPDSAALKAELMDFAASGGALFLGNEFWSFFPAEVIGAWEFVKLDHCPTALTPHETEGDLAHLMGQINKRLGRAQRHTGDILQMKLPGHIGSSQGAEDPIGGIAEFFLGHKTGKGIADKLVGTGSGVSQGDLGLAPAVQREAVD